MPNPTKDQLTINALRERVELLEKKHDRVVTNYNKQIVELGKDVINFDLHLASKDEIINNKDFIIKDQKSVILDYKSIVLDKEIDIECLKIENEELNKQLSYKDDLFNFIVYPILVVSVFSLVITLIK